MILAQVEELLQKAIGLDAASIGSSAVARALQERRLACALPSEEAYWDHLRASNTELQELIEAIVVPETWFFRDREAFGAMERIAREEWLAQQPQGVLSLLSLPCSTGEEPYAMAMALLDAGVPPARFRIDAVDISARALARAAAAVYGKNSFRGNELGFRERHCEALADGHRVARQVRERVRFLQGNLLDGGLLAGEAYDVIFCRNVLIYFDRPTQDRAVAELARLLAPRGVLFVGPSETGLLLDHGFASAKVPLAFAFRRASAPRPAPAPRRPHAPTAAAVKLPPPRLPAPPPAAASPQPARALASGMAEVRRLADQGRLREAAQGCERHLREHGPSAEGFYLLGLVRDAGGDQSEAVALYRKALYIDPGHLETLVHLALVMEKLGDSTAAQLLHKRARLAEQKRGR